MCSEYTPLHSMSNVLVSVFSACLHDQGRSCCGSTRKEPHSYILMHMTSMWSPFLQGRGETWSEPFTASWLETTKRFVWPPCPSELKWLLYSCRLQDVCVWMCAVSVCIYLCTVCMYMYVQYNYSVWCVHACSGTVGVCVILWCAIHSCPWILSRRWFDVLVPGLPGRWPPVNCYRTLRRSRRRWRQKMAGGPLLLQELSGTYVRDKTVYTSHRPRLYLACTLLLCMQSCVVYTCTYCSSCLCIYSMLINVT